MKKVFLLSSISLIVFSLSINAQKSLVTTTSTTNQLDELLHSGKVGLGQRNTYTDVALFVTPNTQYAIGTAIMAKVGYGGKAIYGVGGSTGSYAGYFEGQTYFSGNMGIGTTNPSSNLHVYGSSNPGISLSSNNSMLQLGAATCNGCFATGALAGDAVLRNMNISGGTNNILFYIPNSLNDGNSYIGFADGVNGAWMKVYNNKILRMDGKLYAREINVLTNVWADFVFKPGYQLRSLIETEQFIKENQHLPELPSEADVKKNGINVAEMNVILLKKIEEMTLYMIDQEKQMSKMNSEIEKLKSISKQ